MKMALDWIVGYDGTMGEMAYAFECRRCGSIQKVATPIAAELWIALGKAFARYHRRCRVPAAVLKADG
jgi:hypothetical protein